MRVGLYFDDKMIEHDPGRRHPERPDRLRSIRGRLESAEIPGTEWRGPEPIGRDWIERVHRSSYVDRILDLRGKSSRLDPDTAVSSSSVDAALLAAGGVRDAVEAVCSGELEASFALVRPPGHHAEPAQAMGFCLFNNVAIGANWALECVDGVERVAIVDWDVHHGNGTQTAFEDRDDVLFVSVHQHPFYPGTGPADAIGVAAGEGYTVNVALPAGMGDGDYEAVFRRIVDPTLESYDPDLILVSAGFDAHQRDPLAGMELSSGQFGRLCSRLRASACEHADGNIVLTLEGGYDLDGLADSVECCTRVLAGGDAPEARGSPSASGREAIDAIVRRHESRWPVS